MPREPMFMAAAGMRGIGKSYQNIMLIDKTVAGNPATGQKPRRVLIYDPNDEYTMYKVLSLRHLSLFSVHPIVEARRIRPFDEKTGEPRGIVELQEALKYVLKYFREGLLVIEDQSRFISPNMNMDLIGAICTNRHKGMDILTSVQGIGKISPTMWDNLNFLRLHFVSEIINPNDVGKERYPFMAIAQNMINNRYHNMGDERLFIYIDLNRGRLTGAYTKSEFKAAALDYLSNNYSLVTRLLTRRAVSGGGKMHTEESALQEVLQQLTNLYSQYAIRKRPQ